MSRLNPPGLITAAAALVACTTASGPSRAGAAALRAINFELAPTSRGCPATTPVTPGGPGLPATYAFTYKVTISNNTDDPVTVSTVASAGGVVAATNGVGVGRTAHVFAQIPFSPNTTIPPGQDVEIAGAQTVLCGDNPIITQETFWDIATQLNIVTSGGPLSTSQITFRRNWSACDAGHPCPATQPPLPSN